ncbi:MAG: glycosyltransferase family 39 protein, partial [Anaerolineales bacterium]
MNKIHRFFILNLIAGVGSLAFLLFLPADTKNAWVFGYSRARLGMAFVLFLVDVIFLAAVVYARAAAWETVIEKLTRHDLTMNVILILTIVGTGLCFGLFFGRFFVSDRYGAYFTRLSPFVFLASVFFLQSLFELRLRLKRGAILQGFFAILFTLLAFVYYTWALNHANTRNPDLQFSDQRAYLRIAQKARATNFKYTGDRNRMPLYPYIQALFYDPTHSDPEAFDRGKVVNIVLSLVLLILIFLIARRYLTLIPAATFTLTTAFVLFVFKAGYFQVEIFFYFMIFVTYLLMGTMITRPNIKTGVLTGAFVGLTHLTKASVLPGLGVFIAVFLFKGIVTFLRSRKESTNSVRGQSPTREYAL